MSVSTGHAFGLIQLFYLDEIALFVLGKHHLGDALPVVDDEVFLREVDEQHHDFATIIGIDMPGVLSTVMPCFRARPLRGRICAS